MNGTLYGVGVGPGDPRMMTLLAVETIRKCTVIAVPAKGREHAMSYRIAEGMVEGIAKKECLTLSTPMTKDPELLKQSYEAAAAKIIEQLKEGRDVAYLTLGDPTIYSTYIYIQRLVKSQGFPACIINGVPSFCAAAAKMGDSLADRSEQIHIIPSNYDIEEAMEYPGTKILMKAASHLSEVRRLLQEKNQPGFMIENCGLPDEHIYSGTEEMPEEAGYYTIVLVKDEERGLRERT